MRSFSRASLTAPALDALAEGSVVWLVYLALVGPHADAPLGLLEFALAAALGVAVVRSIDARSERRAALAVTAVLVGGVAWLANPAVRETIAREGVPSALFGTGPGWLAGVAVLRGGAHRRLDRDDEVLGRLLVVGIVVLAVPWLLHLGSASAAFEGSVILGSVMFLGSALLALAYGRLSALGLDPNGSEGGRAWSMVAGPMILLLAVVALVAAAVIGAPVDAVVAALAGPLVSVVGALLDHGWALLAPVLDAAGRLVPPLSGPVAAPSQPAGAGSSGAVGGAVPGLPHALVVVVVFTGLAVAVALLVRYRHVFAVPRPPAVLSQDREDRDRLLPRLSLHVHIPMFRPRFPQRRPQPRTAVAAYLAVLHALARHPDIARLDAESPLEHVRRVRGRGLPDTSLSLLAADFQLAEYGGRDLGPTEDRKANARGRRIREAVRNAR